MCNDSQCPACRVMTDRIYHARQVLAELHEKMESGDYSMQELPVDAQLGFKILAELVSEVSGMSALVPELNQVGQSLRFHLEAFNSEIQHMEGLAPGQS